MCIRDRASYYRSKQNVSKQSNSYQNALYNIGIYEYLNTNYDKSEFAFKELLELSPKDFQTHAKLVQVYYGKKAYEKADSCREILYKAYENSELKGSLKNRFCFDQFVWNEKRILVYENFATVNGEIYYKHVFYIPSDDGKTRFTIQTENSPIAEELGSGKYAVGMTKNGTHSTFGFIKEDFKYEDLKKTVIEILEGDIVPSASSRTTK